MVKVEWLGGMAFEAIPPTGSRIVMDAHPEMDGQGRGPTPVEAFLAAIAACSGMDVIAILQKKRQVVTSYHVEIEGVRAPEGEWPRPFVSITIRHVVTGDDIDPAALKRAVELTDQKYCSVLATIRKGPPISSEWQIGSLV